MTIQFDFDISGYIRTCRPSYRIDRTEQENAINCRSGYIHRRWLEGPFVGTDIRGPDRSGVTVDIGGHIRNRSTATLLEDRNIGSEMNVIGSGCV